MATMPRSNRQIARRRVKSITAWTAGASAVLTAALAAGFSRPGNDGATAAQAGTATTAQVASEVMTAATPAGSSSSQVDSSAQAPASSSQPATTTSGGS
jgi:hypothetical protein